MMTTDEKQLVPHEEMWAVVSLMGHAETAGRIEKPTEWGGLLRVDVPQKDGSFQTEFYGIPAIYRIKFVSEEIARAYAPTERDIYDYDTPIVTREQHDTAIRQLRNENFSLESKIEKLQRRLTAVEALPPGEEVDF